MTFLDTDERHNKRTKAPRARKRKRVRSSPEEFSVQRRYKMMHSNERSVAMSEFLADRSNKKLRDRVVLVNTGLVYAYANKIYPRIEYKQEFEYDDIVQMGIEGLIASTWKYDLSKGEFSTFATSYIRGYILNHIDRDTARFNALRKKEDLAKKEKEAPLTKKEQALYEQIELYLQKVSCDRELLYSGYCDDDGIVILDTLASQGVSTEGQALQNIEFEKLKHALGKLSKRSAYIIRRHIFNEATYRELAEEMECKSHSWPQKLYLTAIQELRAILGVILTEDSEYTISAVSLEI